MAASSAASVSFSRAASATGSRGIGAWGGGAVAAATIERTVAAIKTFGEVDERSLRQLRTCMEAGDAELGVLCADHHPGYSQPIGGGIAYEGYVSPSGVGYDIACGNKAVQTNLKSADLDVAAVMREIARRTSSGRGGPNRERVDHPVLEKILRTDFAPQRKLAQLARTQPGAVGSGTHFVNLFADEEGTVWVGVHFGSRGFGHKTASGFLALAQGLAFEERAREGAMDSPPVLFPADSELGQAYVGAMELAGEYAYAGRDVVVAKVLEILGAQAVHEVHNHHNFAWREEHFGRTYWVIRKGCTPARPGQEGSVGGSMGDDSVILEGVAGAEAEESLFSTVHGAGRVMSRSEAAGRIRRRKRVVDGRRVWVHEQVKPGVVDWPAVQARLRGQGIVLVGGGGRGRGAGGLQAAAPGARGALPLDPREAHAAPARRRHCPRR